MSAVSFVVPGVPIGKGRARATSIGGHARVYTPAKTANYEAWVAHHAREAMRTVTYLTGPLTMTVHCYLPVPESWSKKKKREAHWSTSRPDLDNIVKAVLDGINQIVFADDAAVCEITASKRYDENPRVAVTVQVMT